jgi:hypothetical protein
VLRDEAEQKGQTFASWLQQQEAARAQAGEGATLAPLPEHAVTSPAAIIGRARGDAQLAEAQGRQAEVVWRSRAESLRGQQRWADRALNQARGDLLRGVLWSLGIGAVAALLAEWIGAASTRPGGTP